MTIRLIAGIRPLDPLNTMGVLRDVLRACGHQAELVCYGYAFVPLTNTIATNAVLAATQPGDMLVGYGNGALAAVQAAECGARPSVLVLVNPVLNAEHAFPAGIEQIIVCYTEDEGALPWARLRRYTSRLLPWRWRKPHWWGAMGRYGYLGNDPRVININITGAGHHGDRRKKRIERVGVIIHQAATDTAATAQPTTREGSHDRRANGNSEHAPEPEPSAGVARSIVRSAPRLLADNATNQRALQDA